MTVGGRAAPEGELEPPAAERINARFWHAGSEVAEYAHRRLHPAEAIIMLRHRDPLGRRVLEVGCGAGRILGYLIALGGEVHGIVVSPAMVDYCRRAYPDADVRVGDLGNLEASVEGQFDAIFAADNVIDVFGVQARRRVLADLRAAAVPGGLLVFSSHNLAHARAGRGAAGSLQRLGTLVTRVLERPPATVARKAPRVLAGGAIGAASGRSSTGRRITPSSMTRRTTTPFFITTSRPSSRRVSSRRPATSCSKSSSSTGRPSPLARMGAGPRSTTSPARGPEPARRVLSAVRPARRGIGALAQPFRQNAVTYSSNGASSRN